MSVLGMHPIHARYGQKPNTMNKTLIYFNNEDFTSLTLIKTEIPDVKLFGSGRKTSI